jgi:NADP-dependent 3-hydroxy acid dehydrogenase YdfG
MVRVATIEPGMVDTELPDHVTDPDASKLMADLIHDIDVLSPADVAETVAFIASVPRHVIDEADKARLSPLKAKKDKHVNFLGR